MSDQLNLSSGFTWIETINWLGIISATIIIAVGLLISYIVRRITYRVSVRFMPQTLAYNIARIIYYILVIISTVSALSVLGINLTGLIIAGGFLGIILGFALQSITANLVSGIFLYWERPLKPGDFVDINGYIGVVEDISIMSTKIRGLDGILIRIPNNEVFNSVIKNIGATPARRLEFTVGIAYREDAEKAYGIIREVLWKHPFILAKPEPDIYVEELGNSSVNIRVRAWAPSSEWYSVRKEIVWRIKKALTDAGIEIPFPQNDVWFRSPLEVIVKKEDNVSKNILGVGKKNN